MPTISPCPVCKRQPKWDKWETEAVLGGGGGTPTLWALYCRSGTHSCHSSYFQNKTDTIIDWERLVQNMECKLKRR